MDWRSRRKRGDCAHNGAVDKKIKTQTTPDRKKRREHPKPREALFDYIAAKLRFSREQPTGTQVFTREVIAGGPAEAGLSEVRGPLIVGHNQSFANSRFSRCYASEL